MISLEHWIEAFFKHKKEDVSHIILEVRNFAIYFGNKDMRRSVNLIKMQLIQLNFNHVDILLDLVQILQLIL